MQGGNSNNREILCEESFSYINESRQFSRENYIMFSAIGIDSIVNVLQPVHLAYLISFVAFSILKDKEFRLCLAPMN